MFGEMGRGIMDMVDQYASRGLDNITSTARTLYDNANRAYSTFKDSYAIRKKTIAVPSFKSDYPSTRILNLTLAPNYLSRATTATGSVADRTHPSAQA
jgi:hypothetical protein